MMTRRPITDEDRRRVVDAEVRRAWPFLIRITPGQRRAIVGDRKYRRCHRAKRATDDAGEWAWP